MATARPFAYNTSGTIAGTIQVGNLAVGFPTSGFTNSPQFWNGPDEELGYVIAQAVSGNTQPTPIDGVFASVGFFRTNGLDENEFIQLANTVSNSNYTTASEASLGLTASGYWNSYVPPPTQTPTPTNTITPTPTVTPTSTDLSSITTYSISGCTNLNVLVVDLGPGFIVPGDVNYYTFTGATPSGCYSVIGKINAPIDDAFTASFGYGGCNDCEISNITPTPTPTNTETPTNTPTPTVTRDLTPTATETPTQTPSTTPSVTPTNTMTPSITPSSTVTPTVTKTPTNTPSVTPTRQTTQTVFMGFSIL